MWNSSGIPLFYARVYTGVLSFLLSQVSQVTSYFLMFQYIITRPKTYFNKQATQPLKIGLSQQRETHFSPFPLTDFLHLFLHFFSPCVTLVTAKKRNCCSIRASMRALRAGARTSAFPTDLLRFSFPPGFSEWIFRVDFPRGFIA